MRRLIIRCPICGHQKSEFIGDDLLELRKSIDMGIVLIKISENQVCEHTIYIEVDKNYILSLTL